MRLTSARTRVFLYVALVCGGISARAAWALDPSLTVQTSTGLAGGAAVVSIQFSTGTTDVSGFLLDVTLPDALSPVSVTAGSAALSAGKAASGNQVSPGVYRIVVIGLNTTVINSGPAALLTLQIANATPPGNQFLGVGNVQMTDPSYNPVTGTGAGGIVTVLTGGAISIFGVAATNVTTTGATIVWTTDVAGDSQVDTGTTSGYGSSTSLDGTPVTSHSEAIGGLSAATTYHYRVHSNAGVSGDFIFSTAGGAAPVISAVTPTVLGASSATVTWSTDIPADSQVDYGTTTAYGLASALDPTLVTSHTQTLVGLSSTTLYHFDVNSHDALGNLGAPQVDSTFTTGSAVVYVSSPVISNVTVSNITPFAADVSWTTDQPSNSSVMYGLNGSTNLTTSNASLSTSHVIHLSNLTPAGNYSYFVESQNNGDLFSVSATTTFTTSAAATTDYPVLTMGSGSGGLGSAVDIDVEFSPGLEPASSIVFYLNLPTLVTGAAVVTGPTALAAGMTAVGTQTTSGPYEVQIGGFGGVLSQSGSVATIHLAVGSGAFPGAYALTASGAHIFDANLNSITLNSVPGTLVITGATPVRVWPNPWRADLHSNVPITFGHLTQGSDIRIFTTSGYWVRTLRNSANSQTWDLKNEDGNRVASGLYYYLITSPNNEKVTGELVVIH